MRHFSLKTATTCVLLLSVAAPVLAQQMVTVTDRQREIRDRPVDLWSVGEEEGESWELLSRVQATGFDSQNNLYILDGANFRVLAFDANGRFLRQIGQQGDGPGEITFGTGLIITPDDEVVVADMGRAAFSIFSTDGTFQRQIGWGEQSVTATGFQGGASGGVVARLNPQFRMGPGQAPPTGPQKATIQRHPLTDGGSFTQLFEFDIPAPRVTTQGGPNNQRVSVMMSGPPVFAPQVSYAALPDGGIALVNSADYAVSIMDANGRHVRTIRRDERPRTVTERDRERARERQRALLSGESPGAGGMTVRVENGRRSYGFGNPPAMSRDQIEQRIQQMEFADTMPILGAVAADPTGRLWIERMEPGANGPIELVTANGTYIGTIRGIARPSSVNRDGTRAAWVETDDLGVERVVVRRLPESWARR